MAESPEQSRSLLSRSARGASFLIGLQISSRALTFVVNQVLLRFLSPALLGASTQLELYVITVLTFARESLRIALGRQSGSAATPASDGKKTAGKEKTGSDAPGGGSRSTAQPPVPSSPSVQTQEAVNLAYLAPSLGLVLALVLGKLYISRASSSVLNIPHMTFAIQAYGIAAVVELAAEPCFAAAAKHGMLNVRARAETTAMVSRCVLTCSLAVWAARGGKNLGAVPFAAGQIAYATALFLVYWISMVPRSWQDGYSLLPKSLLVIGKKENVSTARNARYYLTLFVRPVVHLAGTLYGQSVLKHFLTQGDAFLISIFATISSQGMYALASNYGSLLARMLFQPVEESSRGVFGSLLGAATTTSTPASRPAKEKAVAARDYLVTVLRFYGLLSTGIVSVGPALGPRILRLTAGEAWGNVATGEVLSVYCYYLPLLAFNGILEAFVAATATPVQLRSQSIWMGIFSVLFATAGFLALKVYDMGAIGLVLANSVNMTIRVLWSWSFVSVYFKGQAVTLDIIDFLPRFDVMALGLVTGLTLRWLQPISAGGLADLSQSLALSGLFGASLLFLERTYFMECLRLLGFSTAGLGVKKNGVKTQ